MSARVQRIAAIALIAIATAAPAGAATGDTVRSLSDLVLGPVLYLVAAVGALACLYRFARGDKSAVFLGIGGLVFLALARALIVTWFAGAGAPPLIAAGEFPVYGQSPAVAGASDAVAQDYLRAYGYVGLVACNGILRLMFTLGLPVLVAAVCAMRTYKRVTVDQRPGAVIGYLIGAILILVLGLVPSVTFAPAHPDDVRANAVVRTVARINASLPADAIGDSSRSAVPLAPALLVIAAVDLSEALGRAINRTPTTSEMAKIVQAGRSAQLSGRWLSEYRDFALHCSAAFAGYVSAEYDFVPDEFDRSRAAILRDRWAEGWQGQVPAAGLNLLSPWGDNVLSFVPVHGYAFNDETDAAAVATAAVGGTDVQEVVGKWVNTGAAAGEDRRDRLLFQSGRLGRGPTQTAPFAPQIPIHEGVAWTLPFGAMRLSGAPMLSAALNQYGWAIPFCSVPSGDDHDFPDLTLTRDDDGAITWSQIDDFRGVPLRSRYVDDVFATVARARGVNFAVVDWGDAVRLSLLLDYGPDACHAACGHPSHKLYWGCMVTGRFAFLARSHPDCAGSAATAAYFWGQNPDAVSYGHQLQQTLYSRSDAKDRDTGVLQSRALGGFTSVFDATNDSTYGARLAAVDLILAAPGSLSQVSLASDAYTALPSSGGLFALLEQAPALGQWFMGAFVEIAYSLVQWLCAHLIGLSVAGFLAIYPLFALFALAPGRWHALVDWSRCMLWVLLWPVVVSLGLAAANAGEQSTGLGALLSAQPGAGETLMMFVGLALILLAPAITQVFLLPTLDSLSRVGASVYGTGFRLLGGSGELASMLSRDPSLAAQRPFIDAQIASPYLAPASSPVAAAGRAFAPGAAAYATAGTPEPEAVAAPRAAGVAVGRAAQMQAAYAAAVGPAASAAATAAVGTAAAPGPAPIAVAVARTQRAEADASLVAANGRGDPAGAARAATRAARAAGQESQARALLGDVDGAAEAEAARVVAEAAALRRPT